MGNHLEKISPAGWRKRYQQQAGWTQALRAYLYQQAGFYQAERVLEVGCGPGVILEDLAGQTPARLFGIDLDAEGLALAAQTTPANLTQADGQALPFGEAAFDHSLCHYLLLWTGQPLRVLAEMRRVTRAGGSVLALAEPDYGGRIDYPLEFEVLGQWQQAALRQQGADPLMGRKLSSLFHAAGLVEVQVGVLGGQWRSPISPEEWQGEWRVLRADLSGAVDKTLLDELQQREAQAYASGERILYIPTFYAIGKVTE